MEESPKIFTLEDFEPLIGQNFTLSQEGLDETVKAELLEAKASRYEAAPNATRDPFSLLFQIEPRFAPPQCVCTVSHDAFGSIALLLVPVGEDEKGYKMEAVLN